MTIERLSDLAVPDPYRLRRLLGRDRDHDGGFSRTYREGGWTGKGQVQQQLTGQSWFSLSMSLSALLNALSGLLLYWPLSEHLRGSSHKGGMK